jgi:hypothetical protein
MHQLASDVVNGRNVVGVEGVPQPKAVGEERCAEKQGVIAEFKQRP